MKRLGYKDVLISTHELVALVSKDKSSTFNNTIKVGTKRYRTHNTKTWVNVLDIVDNGTKLIHYNSIPARIKQNYNLPLVNDLIQQIKNGKAFDKLNEKQCTADLEDMQILSMLEDAADNQYIRFCPQYLKLFPNEQDKVITYARTHSVANALIGMRCMHKVGSLHGGVSAN